MDQPDTASARDDGELLAEFALHGRQEAFTTVARRHAAMVLRVCGRRLGNTSDAQDAAQAVFLTLARRAASLTGYSTVAGWLHRVAWYVAARCAKVAATRRRHELEAARMRSENPTAGRPIASELLDDALAALPEKYRLPLILHHLEGRTEDETAALLGLSVSATSSRLSRAREKLRFRLSRGGAAVTAGAVAAVLAGEASANSLPVPQALVSSIGQIAANAGASTATTAVSASAAALSQGAIHMLFMAKMKLAAMVTAAVVLIVSAGLGTYVAFGAGPSASPAGPRAGRTSPAALPATTPTGWTAFQADGIEVVRAVQVNAGRCRVVVALLPDGRSTVDASGDIEMTTEEYALHAVIQRARLDETRPDDITADQQRKLAAHPERLWIIPLVRESDKFLARWNPWTNQLWDMPKGKALEPITAWMKMEEGPAREAGKKELVALVREKLGAMEAVVRQKLKAETALGTEVLSPQQRAALAAKVEKSHPRLQRPATSTRPASAPAPWVHLNERGDGVHEGLILLAKQGNVSLTIKQGAGFSANLPQSARSTRGGVHAQHGLGVRPDFLGGDAYFSFLVSVPADPALKDATKEIRAGTNYLRLEKRRDGLRQLKLTPEQSARIAELRKKAPDVDPDGAAALNPTRAESERLRALVNDWWQSKPTRQAAGDALLAELKQFDQTYTAKLRAFHTLARDIGATLTAEQRDLTQKLLLTTPATAPARKPAPPLLPDEL